MRAHADRALSTYSGRRQTGEATQCHYRLHGAAQGVAPRGVRTCNCGLDGAAQRHCPPGGQPAAGNCTLQGGQCGQELQLQWTYAKQGTAPRRQGGDYAHTEQFKRLKTNFKRQSTLLGGVLGEIGRQLNSVLVTVAASAAPAHKGSSPKEINDLKMWLERAGPIHDQRCDSNTSSRWARRRAHLQGNGAQTLEARRQG